MHRNKQPCIQILRKRSNAKTKSYRLYRTSLREQNPNDNSNVNRQTNDRSSFQKTAHRQIFQKIFTTTEVGHGKDKPDIFIKAMEEMGTTPKQTWLFEDGAYSIETAKQLGIKTIGIYDPASEKDQEKIRNLTNIYIKNWTEHKTLLNQIQNNK